MRTVITGLHEACLDAEKKLGISSSLILCFLRHLSEESAFETLEQAIPFKDLVKGEVIRQRNLNECSNEQDNSGSKPLHTLERKARQLTYGAP